VRLHEGIPSAETCGGPRAAEEDSTGGGQRAESLGAQIEIDAI
jgi:hypothetical protein